MNLCPSGFCRGCIDIGCIARAVDGDVSVEVEVPAGIVHVVFFIARRLLGLGLGFMLTAVKDNMVLGKVTYLSMRVLAYEPSFPLALGDIRDVIPFDEIQVPCLLLRTRVADHRGFLQRIRMVSHC